MCMASRVTDVSRCMVSGVTGWADVGSVEWLGD